MTFVSASTDETNDFDPVVFLESSPVEFLTIDNLHINFHGHAVGQDLQFMEQISNGAIGGYRSRLAIELDVHRLGFNSMHQSPTDLFIQSS
jgi:hypothetical protein